MGVSLEAKRRLRRLRPLKGPPVGMTWDGEVFGSGYHGDVRRTCAILAISLSTALAVAGEAPRVGAGLRWVASAATKKAVDVPVLVRFSAKPGPGDLERLERDGLLGWRRHDGKILGATTVFLAVARTGDVAELSLRPGVLRVEADWGPSGAPPLDATAPLIGVDRLWPQVDDLGRTLTGEGVLVADLDSGVDPHHPALMRRTGEPVDWYEEDGGGLDGHGREWVDLDGDEERDQDETLRVLEAPTSASYHDGNPTGYTPGLDWLYADTDRDGRRDRAPDDGWNDASPALGEPLLLGEDSDADGILEPGEPLYRLDASKVAAVRAYDGRVFRRGVDLTETPEDPWQHGTPVCGILAGGSPGLVRFTGMAPDADLLVGMIPYADSPRFWRTMPEMAAWSAAEGADVLLIEDGEWVWEFMDGSSAGEVLLSELARDHGVVVTAAAGNLAWGGQHHRVDVTSTEPVELRLEAAEAAAYSVRHLWLNVNFRGPRNALRWHLDTPVGSASGRSGEDNAADLAGATLDVLADRSIASTEMVAFHLGVTQQLPVGDLVLRLETDAGPLLVDAFKVDDLSGWGGAWQFDDACDDGTVTWPATAHDVIVVGGYSGHPGFIHTYGDLNFFSGRGAALDGRRLVDLVAPGSVTFSAASSGGGWTAFGGTSAALPHVAGVCALLVQAAPEATPRQIEWALTLGARRDAFTGAVPDHAWGYGKLDAVGALEALRGILSGAIPIPDDLSPRFGGRRPGRQDGLGGSAAPGRHWRMVQPPNPDPGLPSGPGPSPSSGCEGIARSSESCAHLPATSSKTRRCPRVSR